MLLGEHTELVNPKCGREGDAEIQRPPFEVIGGGDALAQGAEKYVTV